MTTEEKLQGIRELMLENLELTKTQVSSLWKELAVQAENLQLVNEYVQQTTKLLVYLKEQVDALRGDSDED